MKYRNRIVLFLLFAILSFATIVLYFPGFLFSHGIFFNKKQGIYLAEKDHTYRSVHNLPKNQQEEKFLEANSFHGMLECAYSWTPPPICNAHASELCVAYQENHDFWVGKAVDARKNSTSISDMDEYFFRSELNKSKNIDNNKSNPSCHPDKM